MNTIVSFIQNFFPRCCAAVLGFLWAYLEPTVPYALLCVFAVMLDCLTAYRLNRRIKRLLPNAKTDGKLKSARMSKMISDLTMVWLCILLAASAKKQAEHYHQKYSYYIFSIHYYSPNQFSLISFSIASISSLNSREETLLAPCPIIISCSSASDVTTVTLCFLLSSCVVFSI